MKTKKANEARRNRENLATENMADSYIKKLLKVGGIPKGCNIPQNLQNLIEAKRAHLKLFRLMREMKKGKK